MTKWRVSYGCFYLNDKLIFDSEKFNRAASLDQLSQLQRLFDTARAESNFAREALVRIREVTQRRQLPITNEIWEIADQALNSK